jgi:hypothetical protein
MPNMKVHSYNINLDGIKLLCIKCHATCVLKGHRTNFIKIKKESIEVLQQLRDGAKQGVDPRHALDR